ncbi:hypothetical protein DID77_00950 [Candidatus Marinamargulisbacteria bacterium SCGC AG-439-L15]|nr:hypothetical protein DID77_00950 [Candidatus Marinamargulisbacteria bacterium SCGC AG-439-L15]
MNNYLKLITPLPNNYTQIVWQRKSDLSSIATYLGQTNTEGSLNGEGQLMISDIGTYEGLFKDNQFNGDGTFAWQNHGTTSASTKKITSISGTFTNNKIKVVSNAVENYCDFSDLILFLTD